MEIKFVFDQNCIFLNYSFVSNRINKLIHKIFTYEQCTIYSIMSTGKNTHLYTCVKNFDLENKQSDYTSLIWDFELNIETGLITKLYTDKNQHPDDIKSCIVQFQKSIFDRNKSIYSKLYIAVLDEVPDYMVPTLVAHTVLGADISWNNDIEYQILDPSFLAKYNDWKHNSFRKVVLKVSRKEFDIIKERMVCYLGHENKTLNGEKSCIVVYPVMSNDVPKILKYAKLWKPNAN